MERGGRFDLQDDAFEEPGTITVVRSQPGSLSKFPYSVPVALRGLVLGLWGLRGTQCVDEQSAFRATIRRECVEICITLPQARNDCVRHRC
jgi:hypothetical protein